MAVKEMAPSGARRHASGELDFQGFEESSLQRLRYGFIEEAKLMKRLRIAGIPQVYDAFLQHSTAYYVCEYFPDAITLHQHLLDRGPLSPEEARRLLMRLASIVDSLHKNRVIHRDIKPSNVLIRKGGQVLLIDFGAAREWAADRSSTQTVMHTPGFAPPEQLGERARRGPATDLYSLCATVYNALVGAPPPSSGERVAGAPLLPLSKLRPDVDPTLAHAVECGLALRYGERPPDVEALLTLLDNPVPRTDPGSEVWRLDQKRLQLKRLRHDRNECPECGDLLERVKPLKPGVCPVCRLGPLKHRRIELRLCPSCRKGVLRTRPNEAPLRYCPSCANGLLKAEGGLMGLAAKAWRCTRCDFKLDHAPTREEWQAMREDAQRSDRVSECDTCGALYDWLLDGRRKQVYPPPKPGEWLALTPQEWGNVAQGLEPGAGNRACLHCEADWFFEGPQATLLGARIDPFSFAERYGGRLLNVEDLPWLGAGKSSGAPGWLCRRCGLELDDDPQGLRLAHANTKPLRKLAGKTHSRLDWHRLARDLPLEGSEQELDEALERALVQAYREGTADFDSRHPGLLWSGAATMLEPAPDGWSPVFEGKLRADLQQISLYRRLRKRRWQVADTRVNADEHLLVLIGPDGKEAVLELEPVELVFRLESGRVSVSLCAEDLAARITRPDDS